MFGETSFTAGRQRVIVGNNSSETIVWMQEGPT
jgi:hypothetical protein